ncbi:unnamed protein product [Cuscuta campestris]|uniref:Uncharacterized protein n=1 Tax=Cuscuta campestris TaxID=132261 RepID=A0A484M394_9ASTE|nr:unnamed protein product [Cuscuta campestris]
MGLNSAYNITRGNILLMRPLPTVAVAYSMLIQEEKQREIQTSSPFVPEHASLNVNALNLTKGRNEDKRLIICDYCKKKGHTAIQSRDVQSTHEASQ